MSNVIQYRDIFNKYYLCKNILHFLAIFVLCTLQEIKFQVLEVQLGDQETDTKRERERPSLCILPSAANMIGALAGSFASLTPFMDTSRRHGERLRRARLAPFSLHMLPGGFEHSAQDSPIVQ